MNSLYLSFLLAIFASLLLNTNALIRLPFTGCLSDKYLHVVAFTTIAEEELVENPSYAISRPFAKEGRFIINGVTLWGEIVNGRGGIQALNGTYWCANITIVNIGGNGTTAATGKARTIVRQWATGMMGPADIFIGPFGSTMTLPVAIEVNAAGKILIAPSASAVSVFTCRSIYSSSQPDCFGKPDNSKRFPLLFGMQPPANLVAVPVITVLRNKGARNVFIWYEDQPYTESIAEGASEAAKQSAMNVTRYIKMKANPTVADFTPIIEEIIATGPDVVIGGTYYDSCKRFLQELERRNFAPRAMFLTTCSADSRAKTDMARAAEFVVDWSEWDSRLRGPGYADELYFLPTSNETSPEMYYKLHLERFNGEAPGIVTALATAAGEVIDYAISRVQTTDATVLRDFLNTMILNSFAGKIGFSSRGQNNAREVVLLQPSLQYESMNLIYPLSAASAELIFPTPHFNERSADFTYMSRPQEIVIAALSAIGIATSIFFGGWLFVHRNDKPAKSSSPFFMSIILVGSVLLYSVNFSWNLNSNTATCHVRFWLFGLGFILTFGPLFIKSWRVMRIFEPGDLRIFKITDQTLGMMLIAVVTIEVVLLAIWSGTSRPVDTVLLAILMTFKFGLMIFGLVVAVRIWRAPQDGYNESRPIAFSIYNIAFFAIVVFGLQVSETLNPQVMFVLRGIAIICATLITVCVIFGHKVFLVHRKRSAMSSFSGPLSSGKTRSQSKTSAAPISMSSTSVADKEAKFKLEQYKKLISLLEERGIEVAKIARESKLEISDLSDDMTSSSGSDESTSSPQSSSAK